MLSNFWKFIIAVLGSEGIGLAGGLFTFKSIPAWYAKINKPSWNPPNWLFGPVWTTLYFLMGVAAYLVWKTGWEHRQVKIALAVFVIQLILNFFWSVIFFSWHSPKWAFAEIILLWLAIAITIILFWRISRPAASILLPYILWVSFAGYLNLTVWQLNR
jgi:tryptophan-rich sensory protein